MSDKVQEARQALAFWGPDPSDRKHAHRVANFQADLDALIAAVRAERVEVTETMVEAGARALAAAAGADWLRLTAPSRVLFLSDARVAITATLEAA